MKHFFFLLIVASTEVFQLSAADTDQQTTARSEVLDLAGAFQNDGFKLRDGTWYGQVSKGHSQTLQVNLYSGNAYWFAAANANGAAGLTVSVFDDQGKPVDFQTYQKDNKAAAGFSPDASGLYFVEVSSSGSTPTTFCLIYSYK
ncbi:MAG: hypothetical protein JO271_10070 [Verrucomicrobia bacterium]|nr:hypothetical protein [Verrucomicrobiota bacterium]MBV9274566.1 hypothetical protein [Verrucomicrobiota bacterium]